MKYNLLFLFVFWLSVALAQTENCACCTENHAAFDFWIGNWEVKNTDGTLAGHNKLKKIENGCVLKEQWTSAKGAFTGTSYNFYNQKEECWEQLWIDNSGNHLKLKGNRIGNKMILASDPYTHTDGQEYVNRITWTLNEDGSVRQLWEVLKGENVVNVAFDGLYTKTAN